MVFGYRSGLPLLLPVCLLALVQLTPFRLHPPLPFIVQEIDCDPGFTVGVDNQTWCVAIHPLATLGADAAQETSDVSLGVAVCRCAA